MNYKNTIQKLGTSLVMAAALTFVASPSFARVDLVALESTWTPAGGTPITMWGFAADVGQACNSLPAWTVGPELTAANLEGNGRLIIRLRNCLSEPVSIIIPGQKAFGSGDTAVNPEPQKSTDLNGVLRITSFTRHTTSGKSRNYYWQDVNLNEGTFLYMSGSHPAKQVHMGLYGALKIGTFPDNYGDVTLLYSEIDPVLHDPPGDAPPEAATPLNYKPRYYLVNGEEEVTLTAGNTASPTVLSFLNAGLDFHVPAINNGGYMSLESEDGNLYPFAKNQYSVNLPAGKTIEALWQPAIPGPYVIYDRRGNGMQATLNVSSP